MTTANKRIIPMTTLKFSSIGLSAFVSAILGVLAFAQVGKTQVKANHQEHSVAMQACAKACSDCQRQCDTCATHCAHQLSEGKKEHLTTLMTCQDCADFCAAASQIVSRGGPFAGLICGSCADACARCGKECEKFSGDEHMKQCAEECRKCEKSCRDMIKHMASK
jgi:hypothetical protein